MLPPTCTRLIPSASWTSRAKSLFTLPTKKKGKGSKGKGGAQVTGSKAQEADGANPAADRSPADDDKEEADDRQMSQQVCTLV